MEKYIEILEKENLTREEFLPIWKEFKQDLNAGKIRVASKENEEWIVNKRVKKFILLGFKYGEIKEFEDGSIDKDTMGERQVILEEKVRKVSSTVSIRDGVYLGQGVTFMPPSYANIGAYIDDNSMIDSLVIVGSCAQIGKNVHIGANVVIGGVLEPVGAYPTIIEDNVFVGAGSQITEGTIVKEGTIIAAGVTITRSTPVYDNVNKTIIKPNEKGQIVIPENAVVIPGNVNIKSKFEDITLSKYAPIIIKYDSKVEFEDNLRL